jgi:hypothetical protein
MKISSLIKLDGPSFILMIEAFRASMLILVLDGSGKNTGSVMGLIAKVYNCECEYTEGEGEKSFYNLLSLLGTDKIEIRESG